MTSDPDGNARQAVEAHLGHEVTAAAWFAPLSRGVGRSTEPPEVLRQERVLPSPVLLAVDGDFLAAFDVTWPGPTVREYGRWELASVVAVRTGPRLMELAPDPTYRHDEMRPRHPGDAARAVLDLIAPVANRCHEEHVRIVPLTLQFLAASVLMFVGVLFRATNVDGESVRSGVSAGLLAAAACMGVGLPLAIVIAHYRKSIRYPE